MDPPRIGSRERTDEPGHRLPQTDRRLCRRPKGPEVLMPKNDKRVKITLECTECKHRNYITMKSKINDRERLEMKKYCNHDRRHTVHKETR